jgi:K+/H+ antiporter YhaU regulatory subunit KhtT
VKSKTDTPRLIRRVVSLPVSETNLRKAAIRLLGQKLVSSEVQYIQRTLGATATQQELDATVVAVRKMPWASIVIGE